MVKFVFNWIRCLILINNQILSHFSQIHYQKLHVSFKPWAFSQNGHVPLVKVDNVINLDNLENHELQ
jgi:hypothetical protein